LVSGISPSISANLLTRSFSSALRELGRAIVVFPSGTLSRLSRLPSKTLLAPFLEDSSSLSCKSDFPCGFLIIAGVIAGVMVVVEDPGNCSLASVSLTLCRALLGTYAVVLRILGWFACVVASPLLLSWLGQLVLLFHKVPLDFGP
jgi:hypothetical protein